MTGYELGKFHIDVATRGYALNRMCFSLNHAQNREAYAADTEAYFDRYGLSDAEKAAARSRDKQALLEVGGNMYFFAKLDRVKRPGTGS